MVKFPQSAFLFPTVSGNQNGAFEFTVVNFDLFINLRTRKPFLCVRAVIYIFLHYLGMNSAALVVHMCFGRGRSAKVPLLVIQF